MKDIQEKRLENEIKFLTESQSEIQKTIKKISKDEYHVNITIPSSLSKFALDIELLLLIQKNYPFNPPKLFFITKFIFPHLSDCRDILEDVLETAWVTQYRLVDIVEKIPKFISEYSASLHEGYLILAGNYYLGEKYDINFIESLPVYTKRVRERQLINNKPFDTNQILMISDLYFCLFEVDKKNKNLATLTFWSNIKALITIRRIVKDNICVFIWRNKLAKKKLQEIKIIIQNGEELVNLILGKMECFGINYNISQRSLEPKEGKLPNCDIDMVEKEIEEIEKKMESSSKPSLELVQYLMTLYEKAVEFYSAINNPRYEHFTQKIQDCLKSQAMVDFMNKENDDKKKAEPPSETIKGESKPEKKVEETPTPITSRDTPEDRKDPEVVIEDKPKTSRSLHIAISKDDDDLPIEINSDEDEDEDENEE